MTETNNFFFVSFIVSVIYLVFKFLEMRYIVKKDIPLKILFRDTLLVYVSCVIGLFIITQINDTTVIKKQTTAFTDNPDF
jgi:hypothetical protein